MKVLLVNETWGLSGGQEEYILQIGNALTNRGHEVKLVYGRFPGQKKGLERALFKSQEISNLKIDEVLQFASRFRTDVVNLQNVFDSKLLISLNKNFPTTRFVHDHTTYCPGNSKYFFNSRRICPIATSSICLLNAYQERCMTRRPLKALKAISQRHDWLSALSQLPIVLCNSSYVKERLVQNGISEEKVLVNHLFPGHLDWGSQPPAPASVPNSKVPQILFVGRLFKEKGADILIEACALLRSPFRLHLVGEGWEKEHLADQVSHLNLGRKVKFLGFKTGQELLRLYQECRFLVLPSVWPEPFGMVGLEAHSFKKPVIAFNVGGIADWLENGVNGFLVEEITAEALSQRMEILINNPDLAEKIGRQGQEKLSSHFNLDRHLDVLEQTYFDLIEKRK